MPDPRLTPARGVPPQQPTPSSAAQPGDRWSSLIADYREGPRPLFGPIIVRRLQAEIRTAADHLRPPAGTMLSADDIQDELVLQVLEAATRMPLPSDPACIPLCLMLRAQARVARWLAGELRHSRESARLEDGSGRG
jgi:hypothetical protein